MQTTTRIDFQKLLSKYFNFQLQGPYTKPLNVGIFAFIKSNQIRFFQLLFSYKVKHIIPTLKMCC